MKYTVITSLLALALLTSCEKSDHDLFTSPAEVKGEGTIINDESSVSTLSFSWQPVAGVLQYGYQLIDRSHNDNVVRQGVTPDTSIAFEKLEADTKYEFEIEAYGANNVATQIYSVYANTKAYIYLSAPDINAISLVIADGEVRISWPAVDHADFYEYTLRDAADLIVSSGSVDTNEVVFSGLGMQSYTLSLSALSDQEDYKPSETVVYNFERSRQAVETYVGTYTSYKYGSYPCTLKIYDDGSYVIESFYGVKGYNLELAVDRAEGTIRVLNAYDRFGKYSYVATGLSDDYVVTIYEDADYTCFNESPSGYSIDIYCYIGADQDGDYDCFEWSE